MLRVFAILWLSVTAFAAPSIAGPYKDPNGRFDVTIPNGWINVDIEDRNAVALLIGREESDDLPRGAICIAMYMQTPETRARTQEELNKLFGEELTPEFWEKSLQSAGNKDETKIESAGSREQSGRKISYVIFTGAAEEGGEKIDSKGKVEFQIVPGSVHFVMCATEAKSYDLIKADFETVFTSYEPHADAVVASLEQPSRSVLTMFAGSQFHGAARVLSRDTPDLAAEGWPTASASLAVDGAEPWQICDRTAYQGHCRTIKAAELAAAGEQIAVASARRLAGQAGVQGLIATQLRRAMQHPAIRSVLGE